MVKKILIFHKLQYQSFRYNLNPTNHSFSDSLNHSLFLEHLKLFAKNDGTMFDMHINRMSCKDVSEWHFQEFEHGGGKKK